MNKNNDTNCRLIIELFQEIPDPRVDRTKIYSLELILFIALCTFLVGGQSFYEMETFAKSRKEWLKELTGMTCVPSHDTFNRVFQALCPDAFGEFLIKITHTLREKLSRDIVAFDGKTHRGVSKDKKSSLHILNAWSSENGLVLGQLAVPDKSNEITAMPQLVDILDLKGCVVTADAMNCQKAIAAKVVDGQADYVFALKENHSVAYAEISAYMDKLASEVKCGHVTTDKGHGRIEKRHYWQTDDVEWFADKDLWKGLKSFGMVEAIRESGDKIETNRRYYISSLELDINKMAKAIRAHWQIENCLHWRLDVIFNEDQSRARTKNAAKNLGTLRALCMNLIKKIPGKASLKCKRLQAALNNDALLMALKI